MKMGGAITLLLMAITFLNSLDLTLLTYKLFEGLKAFATAINNYDKDSDQLLHVFSSCL